MQLLESIDMLRLSWALNHQRKGGSYRRCLTLGGTIGHRENGVLLSCYTLLIFKPYEICALGSEHHMSHMSWCFCFCFFMNHI